MRKAYKTRLEINKIILETLALPEAERQPWSVIAEKAKIPVSRIYDQITKLRTAGTIPEKEPPRETPRDQRDEAVLTEIASGKGGTAEQRRKVLLEIQAAGSDQNRIKAIEVQNKMDEATDRGVGPGVPLTDADRVSRLARLMQICGPRVTARAQEEAFGTAKGEEARAAASQ